MLGKLGIKSLIIFLRRGRKLKNVYLQKHNNLQYFICCYDENQILKISSGLQVISSGAFKDSKIKNVQFEDKVKVIKQSAFENCSELENLIIANDKEENKKTNMSNKKSKKESEIRLGNFLIKEKKKDFKIEKDAFKNCSKLETVILPKCKKLIIEKDAFIGCESLRTVVAVCSKIQFTENPFIDCSENLTFICYKNSEIERFARENGFRYIYVKSNI